MTSEKEKNNWGWKFYMALGYRITEDKLDEEALSDFMSEIIAEAQLSARKEVFEDKDYKGIKKFIERIYGRETTGKHILASLSELEMKHLEKLKGDKA